MHTFLTYAGRVFYTCHYEAQIIAVPFPNLLWYVRTGNNLLIVTHLISTLMKTNRYKNLNVLINQLHTCLEHR